MKVSGSAASHVESSVLKFEAKALWMKSAKKSSSSLGWAMRFDMQDQKSSDGNKEERGWKVVDVGG